MMMVLENKGSLSPLFADIDFSYANIFGHSFVSNLFVFGHSFMSALDSVGHADVFFMRMDMQKIRMVNRFYLPIHACVPHEI